MLIFIGTYFGSETGMDMFSEKDQIREFFLKGREPRGGEGGGL